MALVPVAVVIGSAQSAGERRFPVFEPPHLENAMKDVGKAFTLASESLAQGDTKTAKLQFLHAREELAPTITFWRQHKKDDAVKLLRMALSRLDELDTALSAPGIDVLAVKALVGQGEAACQACHAIYRDQDSATQEFRLRPGSVE